MDLESGGAVLINPVSGIITSSFGSRENPVLDKEEFHTGVDIAVPEKTNAAAVDAGVVTEVGESKTYGIYIKYQVQSGYLVMFAHLSKAKVKEGQKIKQGEVIALTGNTGLSTGPHLHYSLWEDGALIDPMPFLQGLKYTSEVEDEYLARGESILEFAQR